MQSSPKINHSKRTSRSISTYLERGGTGGGGGSSNSSSNQVSRSSLAVKSNQPVGFIESSKEKYWREGSRLDEEFKKIVLLAESYLLRFGKHERIRIEQWIKKLSQVTQNLVWKQNRNLYARVLADMAGRSVVYEPFSHVPPEGPLPRLTKFDIPYHARNILRDFEKENEHLNFDKLQFSSSQNQQQHSPKRNKYELRDKSEDMNKVKSNGNSSTNNNIISFLSNNNSLNNSGSKSNTNSTSLSHKIKSAQQNAEKTSQFQPVNHNSLGITSTHQASVSPFRSATPEQSKYQSSSNSNSNNSTNRAIQVPSNFLSNLRDHLYSQNAPCSSQLIGSQLQTATSRCTCCQNCKNCVSCADERANNSKQNSGIRSSSRIKNSALSEKHKALLNSVNQIFAKKPRSVSSFSHTSEKAEQNNNDGIVKQLPNDKQDHTLEGLLKGKSGFSNFFGSAISRQKSKDGISSSSSGVTRCHSANRETSSIGSGSFCQNDCNSDSRRQSGQTYQQNLIKWPLPKAPHQNSIFTQMTTFIQQNHSHSTSIGLDSKNKSQDRKEQDEETMNFGGFINKKEFCHFDVSENNQNQKQQSYSLLSQTPVQDNPQGLFVSSFHTEQLDKEEHTKSQRMNSLVEQLHNLQDSPQLGQEMQAKLIGITAKVGQFFLCGKQPTQNICEYDSLLRELESTINDCTRNIQAANIPEMKTESLQNALEMKMTVLQDISKRHLIDNRNHIKRIKRTDLDSNYQQYAESIKQKLIQTNQGTNEFLSYLSRIKQNIE